MTSTSPVLENETAFMVAGNWDMVGRGLETMERKGLYSLVKIEHILSTQLMHLTVPEPRATFHHHPYLPQLFQPYIT